MKIAMVGLGKLDRVVIKDYDLYKRPEDGLVHIYVLLSPQSGEARYVGKTKKPLRTRLREHAKASNGKKTHVYRWIKCLLKHGLEPEIALVCLANESMWQASERCWIKRLRKWGHRLTNHTEGGDGANGLRHSEKTKELLRQKRKLQKPYKYTPEQRARISRALKGKKKSKQHRENVSKALLGKPTGRHRSLPLEVREKISRSLMGRKNPEHSARMKGRSSPMKGRHHSSETREKLRLAALRQHAEGRVRNYQDPEVNLKISKALTGLKRSEETKRKVRETKARRRNQCRKG